MADSIAVKAGRFSSVEEILDFAIAEERQADKFYTDLAQEMESQAIREVFEDFAKEELGHKAKLEAVKRGKSAIKPESVRSLGIADRLVDVEPKADMSYADVLNLTMRKEKAAYRLYLDLAVASQNEELSDMFLNLAQEEAKHNLWFETEYDELLKELADSCSLQ